MSLPSPNAAADLAEAVADGDDAYEMMGNTDCPHGCVVEPDGTCSHDYESAGLTAELI